jgi:hypothetical protein
VAFRNIPPIFVTALVFHDPMFWLKAVAPENIADISVTALVFHDPMFWLKAAALENILDIFVTALVFQFMGQVEAPAAQPLLKGML